MNNKNAIIVAIVVGAIGSGLWEMIKPMLSWASNASLTIVTLGIESLTDGIYLDIAKMNPEGISIFSLSIQNGFIIGIAMSVIGLSLVDSFPARKHNEEPKDHPQSQNLAHQKRKFTFSRKTITPRKIAIILLVITTSAMFFLANRAIYVSNAVAHFNRLCVISAPYITEKEMEFIKSDFAQISNREDYKNIIEKVASVARAEKKKVPDFKIY